MKLREFANQLDRLIPGAWSEQWDNPGLLSGDLDSQVEKVAISLNATLDSIRKASAIGANVLVTHHPVLIKPTPRVLPETLSGASLFHSIKAGIALYAVHTNWDASPKGVNRILSEKAGLNDVLPLLPGQGGAWGTGAVGVLKKPLQLGELSAFLRESWGLSWIRVQGKGDSVIRRLALCGGSGGGLIAEASRMGADAFVTADLRYHEMLEGRFLGLSLLTCDHGEMEAASLEGLSQLIMAGTGLPAEVLPEEEPVGFFDLGNRSTYA